MGLSDRIQAGLRRRKLSVERLEDRRVLASVFGGSDSLLPRAELVKPESTTVDHIRHETDRFVVKFRDDLPFRLRDGELVEVQPVANALNDRAISAGLHSDEVQLVFSLVSHGSWERMDRVSEDVLEQQRQVAQVSLGRRIADLNSYFYVNVTHADDLSSIIDAFNTLDIVEIAQPIPRPAPSPSQFDHGSAPGQTSHDGGSHSAPPPLPGNFQPNQGYLNAAPAGVDALGVWDTYRIRGADVRVLNIEYLFDEFHLDLPPITIVGPTPEDAGFGTDHGTAVMGQMGALDNGWGVTGIAPDSQYYFAGAFTGGRYALAEALTVATATLDPGDVILIEQQTWGPNSDPSSGSQFGMVPVEWFEPYYSRIVTAVGNGIIVVEAGANGSQNLDDPIYSTGNNGHHPFLAENSSGAIIVGAGASPAAFGSTVPARSRLGFSNYGSRVNLQGWGHNVWTTGYGDAYSQEGPHLYFTRSFSGTSSASPIVAGAISLVQSAHKQFTGDILSGERMLEILLETGSPQQDGPNPLTQHIGPLPNAMAAIEQLFGNANFRLTIAPAFTDYVENNPPVPIAADSQVESADFLGGVLLRVTISSGWQEGDELSVIDANGISVDSMGVVRYNDEVIGSLQQQEQGIAIRFTLEANRESLQATLRSIAFHHTTRGPISDVREIEFRIGASDAYVVHVNVIPINDPPLILDAQLPDILEDSLVITGLTVGQLWDDRFEDPDYGAFLSGIAVISNPQDFSEGIWHYATGSIWVPIGDVDDDAQSLVLSRDTRLGFLPAPDYFGVPAPLMVRALDNTYSGSFSRVEQNLKVFYIPDDSTTISLQPAALSITVINVNDPPFATIDSLTIETLQDQPILRQFPESYFIDIDSELTWSLVSVDGSPLPNWILFNPTNRVLSGTPRNRDVGNYSLLLQASDEEFTASIPLEIIVINVNDPPEQLRFVPLPLRENEQGILVGTLFAVDPDGDEITWTVLDPRFSIQGNQVFLDVSVDYEVEQEIPLLFTATDNGVPPLSTTLSFTIPVVDVNEFYPDLRADTFSVLSGTPAGTHLKRLEAPDGDIFQTVRFKMLSGDKHAFHLNEETGDLSLAIDVDSRVRDEYRIFIEASDNGTPRFATTAQFKLQVLPVNLFAPEIQPDQQLVFEENLPAGAEIGRILASDADGTPLKYEILELIGGNTNWLQIHPSTGVIRVTAAHRFDYESSTVHSLRVRVSETIEPFRFAEALIPIILIDVNDPPSGLQPVSIPVSRKGAEANPFVVVDQDPSQAGYSFSTTDPRFEIRGNRLALKSDRFFDSSLGGQVTSTVVRVVDNGDPSSFADLTLTIQIVQSAAWQNTSNPLDVNRDGRVSSFDALLIINEINLRQSSLLTVPRRFDQLDMPDFDTNGDNRITALDALLVINQLNEQLSGENPASEAEGEQATLAYSQRWALAILQLEEEYRLRRTKIGG